MCRKSNFRADDPVDLLHFFSMKPSCSTAVERFYVGANALRRVILTELNPKGKGRLVNLKKLNATLAVVILCGLRAIFAQTPEFNIIKPSTTGVPGEEVRRL